MEAGRTIEVKGGNVWYRVHGDGSGVPLLVLHGGPGVPHDYLEPLAALGDDRPVIFYDQLGCGRSDRPDDSSLWTLDRSIEELALVVLALQLDRFHLFGHSWGTMLATDYALSHQAGLRSLILASPALSVTRWLEDGAAYRAALPAEILTLLDTHEAAGTGDSEEYQMAARAFDARHGCRLDPLPDALCRSLAGLGSPVYSTMWGPNEFTATGVLRDYERADRLPDIAVPTLFTCGRHDQATPGATAWYQSLVPGAEIAVFPESAHMPHLEEETAYLARVSDFLARVERASA